MQPKTRVWAVIPACIVFGLAALALPAPVSADPTAGVLVGERTLVPLAGGAGMLEDRPSVKVLSESEAELRLEFTLPALAVQPIEVDGTAYQAVEFDGCGLEGEIGEPGLPTFSRLVMIPDRAGVSVEVEAVETRELTGYRPFPVQGADTGGALAVDAAAYAAAGYEPADPARVGDPALARGLRVVPITFRPLRYDASRGVIEAAARIEVRLRFAGEDLRNTPARRDQILPRSFDALYRALVVNYDGPRDGREVGLGTYVIVCPNNSSVLTRLEPLVEWRTRKGNPVYVATTAETGTTKEAIQAWLRSAYQTWPNPPEYIALIGDTGGTIAIPHWTENYTSYHGETDFPYSQLDGPDLLPDAHIGRISVDTYDRLQMYVDKIVSYESTPYMAQTAWYTRATLVGDAYHSKITCVQVQQWIKRRLLEIGYTAVDTIFASPFVSQMTASLNQGSTAFCYRGWLGMSGWGTGHVAALTNGRKLVYAVNLTCGTGNFSSSTTMSEAWIRAGSLGAPTGGIASVGTATSGTQTRFNNIVTQGIWRGMLWEGLHTFGESLTRGKYELYLSYFQFQPNPVGTYASWNNLMGDPAGEMWTGVPQAISVTHPPELAVGANAVAVDVFSGGQPVAGALVSLWMGTDTYVQGYTAADGRADLPVGAPAAGTMKITVTKHDHHPYLGTIAVGQAQRFVGYAGHLVDDDGEGWSEGNADGQANPVELLELPVKVRNHGTQPVAGATATLSTVDPYAVVHSGSSGLPDIPAGGDGWTLSPFEVSVLGTAPDGHVLRFGLDIQAGAETWHSLLDLPVCAPAFGFSILNTHGFGARIDPGESGELSVVLVNGGSTASAPVTGTLHSGSGWILVTDATGSFPAVAAGGTTENAVDRFGIFVSGEAYLGLQAPMLLVLRSDAGVTDSVRFVVSLTPGGTNAPGGPDGYGYYFLDNTDTAYPDAPVYSWVEIDPAHGGAGVSCGLNDFGAWQDDSKVFDLPFPFRFYGEDFTRVTICSNGWIAMGSTHLTTGQNWPIPGTGGPNYMIAPMWDDLYQSGANKVYHRYDAAQHRYIVQWSRLINHYSGSTENFEVILYDPLHYPTETGDGIIVFQYHTFLNNDTVNQYCTVGIQNGDLSDGLQCSYFNQYHPNMPTIQAGRAIKFLVPAGATFSAAPEGERAPARLALHANAPNPFAGPTGPTTIRFDLPARVPVRLEICDVAGRAVRTLALGDLGPGGHAIPWNGLDGRGNPVESGAYFYILDAGGERVARRMMLLR
ncbi:MAG: hypothetical protein FJY75_02970 [Candidatus Eisenbacteria bacterium]|uniref:T9SS type A sorting domain-containing protein n=1 Tax=Eiseniibacteriota bacterium TaxID=2212470 RepID=A0A937X6K0_UNCEI|nr:hypothetical protein [Candidatus Eisenbacteria bacterium]